MGWVLNWRSDRHESPSPLVLGRYRSSVSFILVTICVAVFTDIFLYGVIVPVIPFALQTRAGIDSADVQHWTSVLLAVYGGAVLFASPLCGLLADRLPYRRTPLLLGLISLAGATLLLCLGQTLALLIIGRILQGISAAVVWSVGLALLADTVRPEAIGQALGYVSISMSLATLAGPLLGGVVYERAGYYAVYYMAFGLIALDIMLRLTLVEKGSATSRLESGAPSHVIEPTQSGEDTAAPIPSHGERLKMSSSNTQSHGQIQEKTKPCESRSRFNWTHHAIFFILRSRRAIAALICVFLLAVLMIAWDAVLPLYVHQLFGWSSLGGGLIFLPMLLPSFAAPLVGMWSDRRGPRLPTFLCFLFSTPIIVLLRFVNHSGIRQIVLLCSLLALLGLTTTLGLTPLFAEVTHIVRTKEKTHPGIFMVRGRGAYATAFGLFNMAFSVGTLVGPLWSGLILGHAGWSTMAWSLGLLSAIAAAIAGLFIGGWIGQGAK